MNNLPIFQYLFDQIETPFLQSVDTMVSAFIRYAAAPLQTALVLYIALTGLLMMRGQSGEPTSGLIGRMVKLCIVAWFATNGSVYSTWVQNFFLNVLPNDVIQAITTAGNGNATINANSFDAIWKQSFEAGLRVWRLLDYWDLGEEIVIVIFWAAGLVACITAFAIWFLSHVILGLFIIIGPLVIGLVLFPATRSIFERWIGAMISCVILQIVTVILVALTLQVRRHGDPEDHVFQRRQPIRAARHPLRRGVLLPVCGDHHLSASRLRHRSLWRPAFPFGRHRAEHRRGKQADGHERFVGWSRDGSRPRVVAQRQSEAGYDRLPGGLFPAARPLPPTSNDDPFRSPLRQPSPKARNKT